MNNSLKRRHDPSRSETFKTTQNQLEKQNPNFNQEAHILNSHKYNDGKKLQNIVAKAISRNSTKESGYCRGYLRNHANELSLK